MQLNFFDNIFYLDFLFLIFFLIFLLYLILLSHYFYLGGEDGRLLHDIRLAIKFLFEEFTYNMISIVKFYFRAICANFSFKILNLIKLGPSIFLSYNFLCKSVVRLSNPMWKLIKSLLLKNSKSNVLHLEVRDKQS